MQFLTFGNEEEVRRITNLLGRYGKAQPLTEDVGYKVSTMWDKSRVLSVRPQASEYWAFVVRKFPLKDYRLRVLLDPKDRNTGESLVRNTELAVDWVKFAMSGKLSTIFSGIQGSGKTTDSVGAISFVPHDVTIRVLEMTAEMFSREIYPSRNIISLQETRTVALADLQDATKKSDGELTILGEIATNNGAARFLSNDKMSSGFQIATHHGLSAYGVVTGIGSQAYGSGAYSNLESAIIDTSQAIKLNFHKKKYKGSLRCYEHMTEIIPQDKIVQFSKPPETYDIKEAIMYMATIQRELAIKQTTDIVFTENTLVKFDEERMIYIPVNPLSEKRIESVLNTMTPAKKIEFAKFLEKWYYTDKDWTA